MVTRKMDESTKKMSKLLNEIREIVESQRLEDREKIRIIDEKITAFYYPHRELTNLLNTTARYTGEGKL